MSEIKKLTAEELNCLEEINFFRRKKIVTAHISNLFSELNDAVTAVNQSYKSTLPEDVINSSGKISKGENYNGFPWIVLDSPRIFQKNNVFAFRSMLWWGHEISFTLHISGRFLLEPGAIFNNLKNLRNKGYYFCINATPWEYHFEPANYILLDEAMNQEFEKKEFIKISYKIPLTAADDIPLAGIKIYKEIITALYF